MIVRPASGLTTSLASNERLIRELSARACALQGCPEDKYDAVLTKTQRESFERGTLYTLAALESLGWRLIPPGG